MLFQHGRHFELPLDRYALKAVLKVDSRGAKNGSTIQFCSWKWRCTKFSIKEDDDDTEVLHVETMQR